MVINKSNESIVRKTREHWVCKINQLIRALVFRGYCDDYLQKRTEYFTPICEAYVHFPKQLRQKLDFKSRKCIFLGYEIDG